MNNNRKLSCIIWQLQSTIRGAIDSHSGKCQLNDEVLIIMTVEELVNYLKIPKSSVYKLAKNKAIPCQKVGKHLRFNR